MPPFEGHHAVDLPAPAMPYAPPELTLFAVFDDQEQAGAAVQTLRSESGLAVGLLDRVVLVRREQAGRRDRARLRRALEAAGAEVTVACPSEDEYLAVTITWQSSGDLAESTAVALDAYLAMPYYLYLRAPWVPAEIAPPLSAAEERNREIVLELLVQPDPGALQAFSGQYIEHMSRGAVDQVRDLLHRQAEQQRESSERRARELRARYPDAPPELFERFLGSLLGGAGTGSFIEALATGVAPAVDTYGPGAALGELLGQMQLERPAGRAVPQISDPSEAFQANCARVSREANDHRLDYVDFGDPLYGLPALLRYLVRQGARQIVYEPMGSGP